MEIETQNELWLAEYQLQHGETIRTFLSAVPRNSAKEAVEAFERLDFDGDKATLIGPVKFVREGVAA